MAVNGLAEGFLAGFDTMNRYQRGKKEDERLDKSMALRDAQWNNELERQKVADDRYAGEQAYSKERDKVVDGQWEKNFKASEAERVSLRKARNHSMNMANRADQRAKQNHQWQIEENNRAAYLRDNMPIIEAGWRAIGQGQDPGDAFRKSVSNPYASAYNPERYMDQGFLAASKTFVTHSANLMKQVQEGALDPNSEAGVAAINSPAYLQAAGVIFQDEVRRGIGDVDPTTGQTITNKELANIMVTPDGRSVSLGLKVTYADGSTAIKPVTEQRTSDQKDAVKQIPINDFLKTGYQRAGLAKHMVDSVSNIRTSLQLQSAPDVKGYQTAMANLEKEYGKNRAAVSKEMMDTEEKQAQLAEIDAQHQRSQQQLATAFGVGKESDSEATPQNLTPIKDFIGKDNNREARLMFLQEAEQRGQLSRLTGNRDVMEVQYQQWKQQYDAGLSAEKLRGEAQAAGMTVEQYQQSQQQGATPWGQSRALAAPSMRDAVAPVGNQRKPVAWGDARAMAASLPKS